MILCNSALQIKDALQLQLDVQRRLHDQLEVIYTFFPPSSAR